MLQNGGDFRPLRPASLFTEFSDFLPTQPADQKSPARAAGTPPFAKKYRAAAALAPLRGATSPAPPQALQYLAAAAPPNVRAKIARRKTPLPSADSPDPREEPPARIVRSSPSRKRSLPKSFCASSSTALSTPRSDYPQPPQALLPAPLLFPPAT